MLSMLFISLFVITFMLLILYVQKYKEIQKKYELLKDKKFDGDALYFKSRYASMGETVGNIAHQWKQPLNAIGSIQNSIKAALLFRGEISKEKLLSSVETSFKLIQHLAETIDTFYSFLSQQNNKKMNFVVADELEKVRKITEYSFQNSKIFLQFDLEVNPTIAGNANEFTHAMLNIILNAKDAFDGSSVSLPEITVHVSESEERCVISICDNAGGIRLDPIDMVFDLHISTKEAGSGLGLFMTKNIIENRFGGKISVANINHGACFTIELPYAENGERFHEITTLDEKTTLERINKLSHKVIELEEVEKALKMWADIFKHARWGIAIYVEASQCFEMSNSAFESLYGYTSKEIKELSLSDFFTPETLPFFLVVQEEALKQGYAVLEAVHIRKDGTTFPVLIELIVVKDDKDKVLYIISNIWDLSQRKEIEENLLLKEFALNKISEAVFLIDENANFQYVNESACKSLGYSEAELLGMGVGDINSKIALEKFEDRWQEMKKQKTLSLETQHTRKDGTSFPVEINSNYLEYQNIGYNLATVRDISERLEIEKRKEDEKMRLFFERQIIGMAITSPKEGWVQTNDKLCEILGYTHEELSQISWVEMTHPEDRERDLEQFNKLLSGEIDDYTLEKRVIRKDQEMICIHLAVSCVRQEDGSVDYILALIEDITERKRAVQALHKSEELYRNSSNLLQSVMESSLEVTIFALDKEYKYLTFNELHKNFYKDKYGIDIALGKSFVELVPDKEFAKGAQNSWDRALSGESFSIITEEELVQNGVSTIEYWNNYISPIFDDAKEITGLTVFSINITKRKEIEMKLESLNSTLEQKVRERTSELQKALDFNSGIISAIPDLMFEVNKEGKYLNVWAKDEKLLAAQKEILLGNKISDILSPEATKVAMEAIQEANAEGLSFGKVLKIDLADGTHWFELSSSKKADGNIIFISRDVTERKRYEQELRELNKNLEHKVIERTLEFQKALEFNSSIIQAIPDILFEISKEGVYLNIWARDEKLLATQKELLLGKNLKDVLPPDAVDVSFQTMKEVDSYGSSLGNTYKLELPDGEHWFELHTTKKEPEGTYLALARDITERTKAQNELIELNATLEEKVKERTSELQRAFEFNEDIINTLPDLLFEMDESGNYLNIWAQNKELLAQQKEALLGNNIYSVLSKQAADTIIEAFKEADISKLSIGKHIEIDLPEGKKWFELSVSKKSDGNYLILSREVLGR